MEVAKALTDKIENLKARVGVIGLGYVGLPLAVLMAKRGFSVIGVEVSQEKVKAVNRGRSYIPDLPSEELSYVVKKGRLKATSDFSSTAEMDSISICVPTPLRKTKDPDISYVLEAVQGIASHLKRGQLIILESTTYPGTTEELILPILSATGLKVGVDFFLAFSPERVDPGNQKFNLQNTPKVVGGITPQCARIARHFYEKFIDRVIVVSSTRCAEMVKLLENTFRAVNIALVNEMAIMCDKLKVDTWEVIEAAATKPFGFMTFYPGPGLGGHCIPVDPHYLSWKLKTLDYHARFIEFAREINGNMPHYVVGKINDALNRGRKSINGSRFLIIGVAYKRDVNDWRESPALDIMRLLRDRGGRVCYHDPFIPRLKDDCFDERSVPLTAKRLRGSDCTVIVTDHSNIDWRWVVKEAKLVVDTRNATRGILSDKIVKL